MPRKTASTLLLATAAVAVAIVSLVTVVTIFRPRRKPKKTSKEEAFQEQREQASQHLSNLLDKIKLERERGEQERVSEGELPCDLALAIARGQSLNAAKDLVRRARAVLREIKPANENELTVAFIKPDALSAGHEGTILAEIRALGLTVVKQWRFRWSREQCEDFYQHVRDSPWWVELIDFLVSGEFVGLVLRGPDAILGWRKAMGPTWPPDARATVGVGGGERRRREQ